MMYKKGFDREFICRTLALLEQYEQSSAINKYENTLFLNLCLGLLVIPKDAYGIQLKEALKDENIHNRCWGITSRSSIVGSDGVYDVIRHLRNGIVHNHCEFLSIDNKTITGIKIEDNYRIDDLFSATLTIKEFSDFVMSVIRFIIENIW